MQTENVNNKQQLIDLIDDWFMNIYQEIYYEERELNKCNNLDKAQGQWKIISHINDNDVNTYIVENTYLKKSVQVVDDDVIGFLPQKDFAFFLHIGEDGKTQVQIVDLEYFQKEGSCSDWHISDIVVTPEFLDEVCEGSFHSEKDVDMTRKELLKLGFVEDNEFSKLMSGHYVPAVTMVKKNKIV